MVMYAQLKIRSGDSSEARKKKKRVASRLLVLREELKVHLKSSGASMSHGNTVRIATWNLREFGGSKYKGRDLEPLYYIAEIISHFDIVALQEVRGDLKEFYQLKRILGQTWDYIATDVTDGAAGNGERMVFLFNQNKVSFQNIAGELTLKENQKIRAAFGERIKLENGLSIDLQDINNNLTGVYKARLKKAGSGKKKLDADVEIDLPPGHKLDLPPGAKIVITKNSVVTSPERGKAQINIPSLFEGKNHRLRLPENTFDDSLRQFSRTPFMISFQAGWLKLNLCTVHIYYGHTDDPLKLEQRRSEIELLTKALAEKAKGEKQFDERSFLGVLGDFNIIGKSHPTMEALESNDFVIPEKLKSIPGSNVKRNMAYDQIAFWKPSRAIGYARLEILAGNIFDFYEHVFTGNDESMYRADTENGLKDTSRYTTWRTYKMSDHLPMWIELNSEFSDRYLEGIED